MAEVTICSDFGARKNKVSHCFHCFPIFCHEMLGPDAMILVSWMLSSWESKVFQNNVYFCFIEYPKGFGCVDHNKLLKILRGIGVADHLTCLMRNLYVDQETTVRALHEKTDLFKIGEVVTQSCTLSPYLFNLYAEYIMRNAELDESQVGIKIAWRNINNLRLQIIPLQWQNMKRN